MLRQMCRGRVAADAAASTGRFMTSVSRTVAQNGFCLRPVAIGGPRRISRDQMMTQSTGGTGKFYHSSPFVKEGHNISSKINSEEEALHHVRSDPLFVVSKSTCPFCSRVKALLDKMSISYQVVELDSIRIGASLQNTLGQTYGQRTVPQVYIKGKLLGGADETFMAYQEGSLQQKLNEAGIQFSE